MKANATTEAAVRAVLNKLAEGYAKRDMETLVAIFAPDPDNVMFGTGAHEKRIGLAEIKAKRKAIGLKLRPAPWSMAGLRFQRPVT